MARVRSFACSWLQKPDLVSVATVAAAGAGAHFLLPATDYVIWDGWWQFADIAWPEGPSITRQHLAEVGRPLDLVYYWPFRFVSSFSARVCLSKVLALALWIASACFMLGVLRRATRVPRDIAVAIAAIVASCPVFAVLGEFSLWMYAAAVFLFWAGWFVLVHLPKGSLVVAGLSRAALWSVFFLSFNLNSQLVAFYAVSGCLFVSRLTSFRVQDAMRIAQYYACRYGDFLLLPVLFWFWKKLWTPSTGAYSEYNAISLAPQQLAAGVGATFRELLLPWIWSPVASNTWLFAACLAAMIMLWKSRPSAAHQGDARRWSAGLVGAGLFLLAANSFPYLVVGQVPSAYGWTSRNAILTPLPLGLLAVGVFLAIAVRLPSTLAHAWKALVVAWIVLNAGACFRNYLALQGFGVKQVSISTRVHEVIGHGPTAVVQLRDYFPIAATIANYAPSIWTFMPTNGSLQPRTFIFETRSALPDQQQVDASGNVVAVIPHILLTKQSLDTLINETTLGYAMTQIPRTGRHVLLCIRPGGYTSDGVTLGGKYLWHKWFDAGRLQGFVREATTSELLELPPIAEGP